VRIASYCGQIKRDWSSVSEAVQGSKGHADPSGRIQPNGGQMWRYKEKAIDPYVQEHMDLINAIAKDTEMNEGKQVTDTTLTGIMGREAAYSGAGVEWDAVLNSKFTYGLICSIRTAQKWKFGAFRTLASPIPNRHDILKDPPVLPLAQALKQRRSSTRLEARPRRARAAFTLRAFRKTEAAQISTVSNLLCRRLPVGKSCDLPSAWDWKSATQRSAAKP